MWHSEKQRLATERTPVSYIYTTSCSSRLEAACKAKAGGERCAATALKNFCAQWITQVKEKENYQKTLTICNYQLSVRGKTPARKMCPCKLTLNVCILRSCCKKK